jgi:DNA polymerase/3'-5' exonuclease PolX
MTFKSGHETSELVQEYLRCKWKRAGSSGMVHQLGQQLGPALRSRIDVLGTDGEKLLDVAPALVMHKLEELEQQAAVEDSGMLERATRGSGRAEAAGELGQPYSQPGKRASRRPVR